MTNQSSTMTKQPSDGSGSGAVPVSRITALTLALTSFLYVGVGSAAVCPANTVPDGNNLIVNGNFKTIPKPPYPIAPKTDLGGWNADVPFNGTGYAPDTTVTIAIGDLDDGDAGAVSQIAFPGDPKNKVPASATWLYSNGNDKATSRVIWRQTVKGLTTGKDYVFYGYYSNVIRPDTTDAYVEPIMNIAVDGKSLDTITVYNHSNPLSGDGGKDVWKRFEYKVTPTKDSVVLTIADDVVNLIGGDDLAITALGMESCKTTLSGPDIAADKTSLTYTGTVAATSAPQTITVSNKGELDLTITKVALAGLNPDDFEITKNGCTAAVKPKGSCKIEVVFKPTVIGSRVAEVQITSNDADTPTLKIPVSGTATAVPEGDIDVKPGAVTFPTTEAGKKSKAETITVSNTGGADITISDVKLTPVDAAFVVDATACAKGTKLKPKASCDIKVTFEPKTPGSKSATVSVLSDDKDEPAVAVALAGLASPSAIGDIAFPGKDLLAKGLAFGELLVQTTSDPKTFKIKNEGGAPLTISKVTSSSPQFTVDATDCLAAPIAAGKDCEVEVTFAPTLIGPQTAVVTIESNDADESPISVPVTGTGLKDDKDSDNDGLTDETEARMCTDPNVADTDADGLPDGVEDENKNGITDRDATTGAFLETDPCVADTDGDGILDGTEDADHDGKVLKNGAAFLETDPRIPDTDGDGLNDGVEDINKNGVYDKPAETDPRVVDTDGDGIADGVEDVNRNGKVDAGETDPRTPNKTEVLGDTGSSGPVLTDLEGGVGGGAAGLPFLSLLGAGLLFRRRRVAAAVAATVAGAALVAAPVQAKEGQFYMGIGVGQSLLDPDPDTNNTGYKVDDDTDFGGKLFLGYDLMDFWSIEGFYADLGSAAMTHPSKADGDIDYKAYGLETLLHFPNTKPGLSGFLKLGVGKVKTESDVVPIDDVEDTQVFGGLGLEYQFESTISLRGEYQYFDEDAQLVTLNLLKRFGGAEPPPPPPVVEEPKDSDGDGVIDEKDKCPGTPPGTRVDVTGCAIDSDNDGVIDTHDKCPNTPQGVKVDATGCQFVVEVEIDSDSDGVIDKHDRCPETPEGTQVDAHGCPFVTQQVIDQFTGVLEGVNFHTNSARLTGEAMSILNGVARQLLEHPEVNVIIVGHTDSVGPADRNKALSLERAKSVARYLVSRGVDRSRLKYAGRGEEEPIASNATAAGRAKNRRVEFIVEHDGYDGGYGSANRYR